MKLSQLLEIAANDLSDLSKLEDPDFRLEQAEFDEKNNTWEIIVSFLVNNTNKKNQSIQGLGSALSSLTSTYQYLRLYKRVKISQEGKVLGMYMYKE